jgi:hypothetical protein
LIKADVANTLLKNKEKTKILKRSWLREGIEDVVLAMGGPTVFCQKIWDREPKEFIKLVGKLLPNQLEIPADTNLIVLDGDCVLIKKALPEPVKAIEAEYTDTENADG